MAENVIKTKLSDKAYNDFITVCEKKGLSRYDVMRRLVNAYLYCETGENYNYDSSDMLIDKDLIQTIKNWHDITRYGSSRLEIEKQYDYETFIIIKKKTNRNGYIPSMINTASGNWCDNKSIIMQKVFRTLYPRLYASVMSAKGCTFEQKLTRLLSDDDVRDDIQGMFNDYEQAEKHVVLGDEGKPVRTRGGSMLQFDIDNEK